MNAKQVAEAIGAVFAVSPPPPVSLHQAKLADQSMSREISDEEWREAGRADIGRTWRDFSDEELIACSVALAHFDEASFVYYIPAFMSFAIRHCAVEWPHPASALVGSVVFSLTRRDAYSLGRYKKLSPEQRKAVVSFLEFMAQHARARDATDSRKALERYWNTDEANKPLIIVP